MQRQQQQRVREALQQIQKAATDVLEAIAPVLAAMHGGENQTLARQVVLGQVEGGSLFRHQQQRINHCVAGDQHLTHHPGGAAVRRRTLCWGEVEQRQLRDQATVGLLRKRIEQIISAQPCLNMPHRDLLIEGSQSRSEGRCGVALHEYQIRPVGGEILLETLQGRTGDMRECLLRGHQRQVAICSEAEQIHHLGNHLAMLAGEHHTRGKTLSLLKGLDHRSELDRLGPGTQNDRDVMEGGLLARILLLKGLAPSVMGCGGWRAAHGKRPLPRS